MDLYDTLRQTSRAPWDHEGDLVGQACRDQATQALCQAMAEMRQTWVARFVGHFKQLGGARLGHAVAVAHGEACLGGHGLTPDADPKEAARAVLYMLRRDELVTRSLHPGAA